MNAATMKEQIRHELGRPEDDDRIPDSDLTVAAQEAEKAIKRQLAMRQHVRQVLVEDIGVIAATDAVGSKYTLPNPPVYLEVYGPPGQNGGRQLFPSVRGSRREGFFLTGSVVNMTRPFVYTPGLYFYGILMSATTNLNDSGLVNSSLPDFLHQAQVYKTAAKLAKRPHSRVNAAELEQKYASELEEVIVSQVFSTPGLEYEDKTESAVWWNSPDLSA